MKTWKLLLLLAISVVAGCAERRTDITPVAANDAEMNAAKEQARTRGIRSVLIDPLVSRLSPVEMSDTL